MKKKYLKTLVLASLCVSLFANGQTPCDNGMAAGYPCNDYDLMSHIPVAVLANTSGNPEGSDIWGWTDPQTGKEYAICAMTNSTAFVDVTNPVNPIFLGRIDTSAGNSFWRDVKVYNNHAFIVADIVGNHGMQVFNLEKLRNITNPPVTFTEGVNGDYIVYNNVSSCHNIVINETEAVAYLVGCRNDNGGGPIFVDISTPFNPTPLGDYTADGYCHDAQVVTYNGPDTAHTGKQIFIGSNENEVVILDVTNKGNVTQLATIDYPQIGYTHQGWFTDDQRYFILGDETDETTYGMNTRTMVFDLLDLDAPVLSSTYSGPTLAIDHNGYVKGDKFYMASYRAGLRVLDISNMPAMTEVGYFDTYPSSDSANFNGAWSVYPYFQSGNIIINDIERGLFVVRPSDMPLNTPSFNAPKTIALFPNPTNNMVTITSSIVFNEIEVYNTLGQKVLSKNNINRNEIVMDISHFQSGIYTVKVDNATTKKLIKQ